MDKLTKVIVQLIGEEFRTFGGGRATPGNIVAAAIKDKPLCFAMGVDVADIVTFVRKVLDMEKSMQTKELGGAAAAQSELGVALSDILPQMLMNQYSILHGVMYCVDPSARTVTDSPAMKDTKILLDRMREKSL